MLYWVGKRSSDVLYASGWFEKTFVGFGEPNATCAVLSTPDAHRGSTAYRDVLARTLSDVCRRDPEAEFVFYSSVEAHRLLEVIPELRPHIPYINNRTLLRWVNNKSLARLWASNYCQTPPSTLLTGSECSLSMLRERFPGHMQFVIQANVSSGGNGTYLLDEESESDVLKRLGASQIYLASPRIGSQGSVNSHLLIDDQQVTVLQPSRQTIRPIDNQLRFCGSEFNSDIDTSIVSGVERSASGIGRALQLSGYRGVVGIDFVERDDDYLFLEINPRFQGSSFLLDYGLARNALPPLCALHMLCYKGGIDPSLAAACRESRSNLCFVNTELIPAPCAEYIGETVHTSSFEGQSYVIYRHR